MVHEEPHDHALGAHCHGGEGAGDDAMPILRPVHRRSGEHEKAEEREEERLQRQHPGQGVAAFVAGKADQRRGRRRRQQKCEDGDHLAGEADVIDDELGAGGDEASGHLRHEQPEQGEKGVAVDITGSEAQ